MRKRTALLTCLPRPAGAWPRAALLAVAVAVSVPGNSAAADDNLGQILDAGAKVLSPEEFKQELVQRLIVGPTATGGTIELMYAPTGMVLGTGLAPGRVLPTDRQGAQTTIKGEWKFSDQGAVCTTLRIIHQASIPPVVMAPRCQFWFKSGDKYFLADSDVDRQAKVLVRTIK